MAQDHSQWQDAAGARLDDGAGGGPSGIFITGGNQVIYQIVLPAGPERDALLAKLSSGQLHHETAAGAVPLPALELRLASTDATARQWRVAAVQPGARPVRSEHLVPAPPTQAPGFANALQTFQDLATRALEDKAEEAALHHAAALLGDALAAVLPETERERLTKLGRGDGLPPLLIIESEEESILSLPWELLRLENTYPVKEGRLDLARCFPNEHGATLPPPTEPLRLLLHVSAPADSGLRYEAESHRIYRAVREHARVTVSDMGEVRDLIGHLAAEEPPTAVHFSGHGGVGLLQFEDEFGDKHNLKTSEFLTAARAARPSNRPRTKTPTPWRHGATTPAAGSGRASPNSPKSPPAECCSWPPPAIATRTSPRRIASRCRPCRPTRSSG